MQLGKRPQCGFGIVFAVVVAAISCARDAKPTGDGGDDPDAAGLDRVPPGSDAAGNGGGGAIGAGGGGGGGTAGTVGGVGGGGSEGGAGGAVDYTSWTFCGKDGGDRPEVRQCLCSAVNQCTASYGELYLGLGSEMFRICGFRDGQCTIAAFREREGAGQGYACSLPLGGNACTNGLLSFDQIAARCTPTFQCNILLGSCPPNFTACPP